MSRRDRPHYVERGGRQVWRPPYAARSAEVFGFVLRADRAAIDLLLQIDLVEPSYGAVDYRAASDLLIVLVADIGQMRCSEPPDALLGFVREREVGVWCLAADARRFGRLVWYLPYIFTDSGQTVATGREVYGYPKQIGIFDHDFPANLTAGGVSTVSALSIDPYEEDQMATVERMISVKTLAPVRYAPPDHPVDYPGLFAGSIRVSLDVPSGPAPEPSATITATDAPPPPRAPHPPPWIRRLVDHIDGATPLAEESVLIASMVANPTLVFLKQFRDISCSTEACYQAVTEASFSVEPLTYRELDPQNFTLTVENYASHPIATEIGVPAGRPIEPVRAFHATLNFHSELGYEVWRATT